MTEPEAPPPELRSLFDAERAAPAVDAAAREALRARLSASLAGVPLGQAAAASLLGGAGKALIMVAIAIAAGAGTIAVIRHGPHETPQAVAHAPLPNEDQGTDLPTLPAVVEEAAVDVVPAVVDQAPPTTAPRARPSRVSAPERADAHDVVQPAPPPTQVDLLRQAWTALRTGDGARALALAQEDEQLHRDGPLVEEREALVIGALAKLDRLEEARAAATSFLQRYPDSVHRSLIRRALEEKVSQ